jgi:chorismate mutase
VSAVLAAHWLEESAEGIRVVKFDEHISESAKTRAQTAKRVAKSKAASKGNAEGNAESVTNTVTKTVPREEKRREEETEPNGSVKRAVRRCPEGFVVTEELQAWAAKECPGVNLDRETAKLRDHTFKTARSDWPSVWRNWMREAFDRLPHKPADAARITVPGSREPDPVLQQIKAHKGAPIPENIRAQIADALKGKTLQ